MKHEEYWKKRFETLELAQMKKGEAFYADAEKQYQKACQAVQRDVENWYARFAVNNNINMVEARRLLNSKELEEFKWTVEDYIKHGRGNSISGQWEKMLENASARWHVSRLDALKFQMQNHVEALFGNELDEFTKLQERVYTEGYYHTAYELQKGCSVGYSLMKLDKNKVEKVLSKPWAADGSNFSQRLWKQKNQLVSELHNGLSQAIIRGLDPHKVTEDIAKRFNVSKGQAGRLVMTETAFFASASTKDCYKDLDVEQYEILATLDKKTSQLCRDLDGKVFDMKDYEVGVTAPPFHVWCRTTTVPYFDDEFELGSKRATRGEDGTTYYVPSDMTYREWEKGFVDGDEKVLGGLEESLAKESAKEQRARRRADVPIFEPAKTLEEAQEYARRFTKSEFMDRTFKGVADYKGLSLESANLINKALTDIYNQLDIEKISGIKAISPTSAAGKKAFKSGADAIASYDPIQHGIYLNKNILGNQKKFDAHVKESEEAWDLVMKNKDKLTGAQKELADKYAKVGRSLVDGKTVEGVITHEVGHHVQWSVLDANTNNAIGSRMKDFAPRISGYANASKGEYIAESFSAYVKGERQLIDPDFAEFLDNKSVKSDAKARAVEKTAETIQQAQEYATSKTASAIQNYEDVTEKWIKEATPNSHIVEDLDEYIADGIKYKVDGKKVLLDYKPREKAVAELLEVTFGGEIKMVPRVLSPQGISTPDYLFHNEKFDLKQLSGKSNNLVYNAIAKKKKQANNFILDVSQSPLELEDLYKQITSIYLSKHTNFVNKLIVIKGHEILKVYKRK